MAARLKGRNVDLPLLFATSWAEPEIPSSQPPNTGHWDMHRTFCTPRYALREETFLAASLPARHLVPCRSLRTRDAKSSQNDFVRTVTSHLFFLGARTDREEVLTGMRIRPNGGFPPSLDVSCVDGEMRTK